jgi:carbohydrate kinase (thermoresistant glucokinase family)
MNTVIYIMGVAGSGKTTIGQLLSAKMNMPFFDADNFHSSANTKKMQAGMPLTDMDRQPWIERLNELGIEQSNLNGAIIGCSALKEKYREQLKAGITKCSWIFLQGDYDIIYDRMKKRSHHFMPAQLLQSQLESLEIPTSAFTIDIKNEPAEIVNSILQYLKDK